MTTTRRRPRQRQRFRPDLFDQTFVHASLRDGTGPARVLRAGFNVWDEPVVTIALLDRDPAEMVTCGGVQYPADVRWLEGWDACRSFLVDPEPEL